jgi:hypothetical protein
METKSTEEMIAEIHSSLGVEEKRETKSELYVTIAVIICATAAMIAGSLTTEYWIMAIAGVSGLYNLGTGIKKHGNGTR